MILSFANIMQSRNITIKQKNNIDKALTNFLNVGFKITDNILDEIRKKVNAFRFNKFRFAFRLKYRFSNVLRNKKITKMTFTNHHTKQKENVQCWNNILPRKKNFC